MLFDCYVSPILSYASEVWGFHNGPDIEKLHLQCCKRILNVKRSTPSVTVYGVLGRFNMKILRPERILKYWLNMLDRRDSIVYKVYNIIMRIDGNRNNSYSNMNWAFNVKRLLSNLGFNIYWQSQDHFILKFCELKQRVRDQYYQERFSTCTLSPNLNLHKLFKRSRYYESYLTSVTVPKYRLSLTKLRTTSHNLFFLNRSLCIY